MEPCELKVTVRAIEAKLQEVRAFVRREREAVPKVEAVIEACARQRQHLLFVAAHLPAHLNAQPTAAPTAPAPATTNTNAARPVQHAAEAKENAAPNREAGHGEPSGVVTKKKRPPAPRRYVTAEELASLSSYMRGRLTLDKVHDWHFSYFFVVQPSMRMARRLASDLASGPAKDACQDHETWQNHTTPHSFRR